MPPTTPKDFDQAYRAALTPWGDVRIPKEIQAFAQPGLRTLELGCGLGRFSSYLAQHGAEATGVDFSPVAIAKARERVAQNKAQPTFLVGDVTQLDALQEPFDMSFDVGCFHCLTPEGQQRYVSEIFRLLKPIGVHLIWALDESPSDLQLSPTNMAEIFAQGFTLQSAQSSRRRLVRSHWYWLQRSESATTDVPAA